MSFQIRDKFAQEVPEDLEDHRPTETTAGGDYSAQVTPPSLERHLEDYAAGVHGPPSEAALEALAGPQNSTGEEAPA